MNKYNQFGPDVSIDGIGETGNIGTDFASQSIYTTVALVIMVAIGVMAFMRQRRNP